MATLKTARFRDDHGQAIIELALTLPLLLLIVLGIFDFGLMFQKFEVVTNAAREGARVGVLPGYSPDDARSRALTYLAAGGLSGTAVGSTAGCPAALSAGTRCVSAVVASTTITGSSPVKTVQQVTVTAIYDYEFAWVGPLMNLFGGTLGTTRLQSVSVMRLE